ncbi:sensor histidine kinase [Jeotgalibacillus soli]|nr:HAMP domain-containing sensor histidine kinase [Jeotgalibacillus soli]
MDLRNIPIVIGGLYMGLGPLLAIISIILSGFSGFDDEFSANMLFYGFSALLLWLVSPWFIKQKSPHRILYAVSLTIIMSFITLIYMEFSYPLDQKLDVWFAYLLIPGTGVAMISYIIEFISKNLLIREHLVKSKKLEVVEQMGAAISHEIRNPLTVAQGFVQLLQETSTNKETQNKYLSIIKAELESAERVIKDYLTFSKPALESIEKLIIQDELTHVLKILQPLANGNSVKISTEFTPKAMIQGDRQKFHQCFLNVLKNAIESMPNGGELVIETVTTRTDVIIRVRDNGIGMTKEQLDRLGEPYYSTKGSKGTGLGMMVVYSIVRAMKGKIEVQSEEGMGTVFQFSFHQFIPEKSFD